MNEQLAMTSAEDEVVLAKDHGFNAVPDPRRGSPWSSFKKGDEVIWKTDHRTWCRAYIDKNKRCCRRKYFSVLLGALIGKD